MVTPGSSVSYGETVCSPQTRETVGQALDSLLRTLDELDKAVMELQGRLSTVLAPQLKEVDEAPCNSPPMPTRVLSRVYASSGRVTDVTAAMGSILDRLEL